MADSQDGAPFVEKILDVKTVFRGNLLRLDKLEVELPNGAVASREVVLHPGAVAVLAVDDQERILCVKQYRVAVQMETIELPAGKLERGEPPRETALRELAEETGYLAGRIEYLFTLATSAGFSNERLHLYRAHDLIPGVPHTDEDEFVEAMWIPIDELVPKILAGSLQDSKTIAAIFAHLAGLDN